MRYRHRVNLMMQEMKTGTFKKTEREINNSPEALARDNALLEAFMNEDIEAVKALLKPENGVRGANPNVKDEFGRTLYHLARRWGWSEIKGLLKQHGGRIIRNPNAAHYEVYKSNKSRVRS
ncbi:MAG: hypothetical protein IKL32_05100 [Alphaproteobacteria bacterium]|nr:hypothetical protein [Alphaproteobacteria bacterium]